ncbi:hydroxyacylglutathione hydrolase [Prochlorococcus sp. MIT 1223]|uniref:hydroxyacylglutathione hydrolase n=1 Tax=Prochlorococcus sp. MIT 1223 TaxID=3096217 RepID=UPI002A765E24|nr:hydroxyacylglutathione hydrolase [Prochlorococcus sp. MIT 1223]
MLTEDRGNLIIHPIPALTDNIIWIWIWDGNAVVVDPSVAGPVITWLQKRELNLEAILLTHHHDDHIGGTKGLLTKWPKTKVIASKEDLPRIPLQTISVSHEDELEIMGLTVEILEIPGHTRTHIAFYIKSQCMNKPVLFCGDTLFAGGCGRLFEGSPENMYNSLTLINSFPSETQIFCGHEYTEGNLRWANSLVPKDISIKNRLQKIKDIRDKGKVTLPTSLSEERKTNLFIRAKNIEELSYLREHKDKWLG